MKNSTIEVKMINQENGEVTEIKFSTNDIDKFEEIAFFIQKVICDHK